MAAQAYIELKKSSLEDPPGLAILKSKYNRIAILLNGFEVILTQEQINDSLTQLKYYQQEIDTYEKY